MPLPTHRRLLVRLLRGALCLGALLAFGCDDDDAEPVSPPPPDEARVEQAGEGLYRRYCALCHGRDGEGYAADDAPALANQEWLRSASDEFIRAAIERGRPGTAMSAWHRDRGGPLRDGEIDAILAYLRSWQRHPRAVVDDVEVRGDAGRGRAVYMVKCQRCHGAQGEGVDAIALANPALLATASDGFLQYAVNHGRSGTRMPAFAEELTPAQINDVVAFVRSFARPVPLEPVAGPGHEAPAAPELPSIEEMALVIHPDGPRPELSLRANRFVAADDVHEAYERGARMIILDARATSDWLAQRIDGAVPFPFYELDAIVTALPRDGTPIIAYCACPHAASGRVVDTLRQHGFTDTMVLDEGIQYWIDHEYPTATGPLEGGADEDDGAAAEE